jgi:ABC-type transport system involved in multi-copper enzyme maturation permease subunit
MKFLAILRDSMREAIDAKVFYVMIGLSGLIILLAASCRFQPKPGARMLMEAASAPLMVDLSEDAVLEKNLEQAFGQSLRRAAGGLYQIQSVEPLDDAPDAPNSTFRVVLTAHLALSPEEHIRKHFGVLDRWRIVEILGVERLDNELPLIGVAKLALKVRITSEGRRLWPHDFSLLFGALPVYREGIPLAVQMFGLENYVVNGLGYWIALLVSVVISAFFIPNMLRKGTIDLLVVKPISRPTLLLYKYVGGLLFIFINTSVAVGGVWLALSLTTGIWTPAFLWTIPTIVFCFAILYSVSTLFAVLTRSPIVCILLTCVTYVVLFLVGFIHIDVFERLRQVEGIVRQHEAVPLASATLGFPAQPGVGPLLSGHVLMSRRMENLNQSMTDNGFAKTIAVMYFILPRTRTLDYLAYDAMLAEIPFGKVVNRQLASPVKSTLGENLLVSGLFIALMLALSCWRFATRDY